MYPHTTPDWELHETHLDEAEFFESQWERALTAPDRRWPHVAAREARFLAHVDALALGGTAVAHRLLRPALESEEAPRVTSAALAHLTDGDERARDAVLNAFLEGPPEPRPGLRRALELCERDGLLPRLLVPLRSTEAEPDVLEAVLEVLAAWGHCPEGTLEGLLSHPEPRVVTAACRVLRTAEAPPTMPVLRRLMAALDSPVPAVRDAALVAGMVLGLRAAWSRCRQLVASRGAPGRLPLLLLAMGGDGKELELLVKRLEEPGLRADVAWALGHSGRRAAAEACLGLLDEPDARVVRLATESLAAITGFPLEGGHVEQEEPSGEEEPEPPDAPPEREAERELPRANSAAARGWWARERERFMSAARYLDGAPFNIKVLARAFGTMPARRWSALALELAIRSRGRCIVAPRALSTQRQQQLTRATALAPRGEQPFSTFLDL